MLVFENVIICFRKFVFICFINNLLGKIKYCEVSYTLALFMCYAKLSYIQNTVDFLNLVDKK